MARIQRAGTAGCEAAKGVGLLDLIHELPDLVGKAAGIVNGCEGLSFRCLPVCQAEELLAVKLPATPGPIRVDSALTLVMSRAGLVKERPSVPFLDLESQRGQLTRVVFRLKKNGVKESSVTAHPAGRAEPSGCFAGNHVAGEVYLTSPVFSVPSVFLDLLSLSVFLDESEQWEESSVPQWPQWA